jgi:predicted metalloprotease with PDZ domain
MKAAQIKRFIVAGSLAGTLALTSIAAAQSGSGDSQPPGRTPLRDRLQQQLQQFTQETRPYLGVRVEATEDDSGVRVVEVGRGTPAAAAGIEVDDVIVAFGDTPITTTQSLLDAVAAAEVDSTVSLTVRRGDEEVTLDATIGSIETMRFEGGNMPFSFGFGGRGPGERGPRFGQMQFFSGSGRLGVAFVTLDETTAEELGVSLTEGAYIREVIADSPAAEAGLEAGDIITAVNSEPVDAERTLRDRLIAYEPGDTITLTVIRGEETLEIEVTLGEPEFQMMDLGQFFNFGEDGAFRFELPIPSMPDMPVTPDSAGNEVIEPVGSA